MLSAILRLPRGDEGCSESESVGSVEELCRSVEAERLREVGWVPVTPCCSDAGDEMVAEKCGLGSFEHCGGFEVYEVDEEEADEEICVPVKKKPLSYWSRLHSEAREQARRLEVKQREARRAELAEESRIAKEFMNPHKKLPSKQVDLLTHHLYNTKSRDANIKRLKEVRERVELKECTFAPAVNPAPHERHLREGTKSTVHTQQHLNDLTVRLYKEGGDRQKAIKIKQFNQRKLEKKKIEEEKRKANPAYAERARFKEDRAALMRLINNA